MKPTFDIRKSFEFVIKKKRDFTGVEVIKMPVKFPVSLKGGDGGDRAIIPSDSISDENDQSLEMMQRSNVFTMRNTAQKKSYDSAFPTGMNESTEMLQVKGLGSKSR